MTDETYGGYANQESYDFEVWTANNRELYDAILAYARECLRRVPGMTDQTLGANIKLNVREWVDMARKGEPIRNLGWGDNLPVNVPAKLLLEMADDIGDMSKVNEYDVGESWRESAEGEG